MHALEDLLAPSLPPYLLLTTLVRCLLCDYYCMSLRVGVYTVFTLVSSIARAVVVTLN